MDSSSLQDELIFNMDQLEGAYVELRHQNEHEHTADNHLGAARRQLEAQRDSVLLQFADNPKGLGANEETRKAAINAACSVDVEMVREADKIVTEARFRVKQASLDVERHRARLRHLEALALLLSGKDR